MSIRTLRRKNDGSAARMGLTALESQKISQIICGRSWLDGA